MKTLYVIGNGFDIYHNLDTRYQSFAKYLAENNGEVYDLLIEYYPLSDMTAPNLTDKEYALWSRFEQALADLDYEGVLNDNSDLVARPGSDDFRDSDWHTYQIEMQLIIEKLTTQLIKDFNSFILKVDYDRVPNDAKISLEPDSHFLNFNYTETLQNIYGVPEELITYIHNKSTADHCHLILGHGTDPSEFIEKKKEPPPGLNGDALDEWQEHMGEDFEYSSSTARQEILSYYTTAFKNTAEIIRNNAAFFKSIAEVKEIRVLGHSISDVDLRYFEEIKNSVSEEVVWHISYYGALEKEMHLKTLKELGIHENNIHQIQIADLKI
ncbi:bacteriophage abortive infection AbiH family protein [Arachidicoccus terrestris]|uniref:bacteriophage abortive infection AbiH family protein n=1 Tax=Arachidicoccus terrestris TaxID=2875539 RepID=UPI001CC64A7B|nr:bacteriophage abortive infection AbiH family protein [Arachidicoccus terrestris]UAY55731.1 bacteriophage abortive infection AbiH family protein [Arachidicoccus terrestris]